MNRHDITTLHALLLATVEIALPAALLWIGCSFYTHKPPKPIVHAIYQSDEFGGSSGTMVPSNIVPDDRTVYDLPSLALSVNSGTHENGLMRIRLGIEVDRDDLGRIKMHQPQINERITLFLRQKNYDDMRDPRKMQSMIAALTKEINEASAPIQVDNVYIKQLLFE